MSSVDTSDALDLTKENIRPLKQGRKPTQLETALQAQTNAEIQQKLNKQKEQYEHTIRNYEGDDPLAPRFEYIKWLEQIDLNHGSESNFLPLLEETVQKFKNDLKYKQDPRFVQILINYIENQPNAVELYQTVYNQGLGTMCALFYRSWADLLDRYNDIKRVDQIFMLGIQSKAEPVEELEQAHLQFQLSVGRRMLNGQLQTEDDKAQSNVKRQAFNVLKKTETTSGIRHGLGGLAGKVPSNNNINREAIGVKVFEDNDENALIGLDGKNSGFTQDGLNKENSVKPGPWTKPKKKTKFKVPVSTVNFAVHEDNNAECITKLQGIKVPHALRRRKNNVNILCPVAVFEPPDPTKKPMYCKEKVYAAGRDIQLEEIRYEMYLKLEKEKKLVKNICPLDIIKPTPKVLDPVKPLKNVILPEDNLNSNDFKVPLPLRVEPDSLSQSVTVNTRVAIDLVQQMWNSPCTDKVVESELISTNRKPISFAGFENDSNRDQITSDFMVYEDNKTPIKNKFNYKNDKNCPKGETLQNKGDFHVYTDNDEEAQIYKIPEVYVDENQEKSFKMTAKLNNKKFENQKKSYTIPEVYIDDEKEIMSKEIRSNVNVFSESGGSNNKTADNIVQINRLEDTVNSTNENKSPFKKIPIAEENDDLTCSTKAFAYLLTSSTPLPFEGTKTKSIFDNRPKPPKATEENKDTTKFLTGKSLSMILELSKERNSSSSVEIVSTVSSATKTEQSTINFGASINPFDENLINKLLNQVVKFPNDRHKIGYVEQHTDVPFLKNEFKLGHNKMKFLGDLGKGAYGRVVKVRSDCEKATDKALKVQKPACLWEWYIGKEIQHRLNDAEKVSYFINLENMYVFKNGSIISMEFATYGTMLSVILAYKQATNRSLPVPIATLFASQVTSAVKYLHECQIIHGDLKPDNVILKSLPNESLVPCVQLIDFGSGIDMTLFPADTSFTCSVKTADFICHEMRDKLPWTYQTDYFGLAGIIYMLLMSDYMKTQKMRKVWMLLKPLPRYIDKDLGNILSTLLNIESCKNLPNLGEVVEKLNKHIAIQNKVVFSHHIASFRNVLKNF